MRKLGRHPRTFEAGIPHLREIVRDVHHDEPPDAYVIADRTWHESAMAVARGITYPGKLSAEAVAQNMRGV
jgi:hypothetical protein